MPSKSELKRLAVVDPLGTAEKLAIAMRALEYCATNDFKIEKTQSVAQEALEAIGKI